MLLRRSLSALILFILVATPKAFGQLKDSTGAVIAPIVFANEQAITVTAVPAPNFGGGGGGGGTQSGDWLKVEFHYATGPIVTKDYPFVDAVEFKVWIEGFDQYGANAAGGKGVSVALTGTVDYINVPMSRDLYGVFYVHPAVVARYSGERGAEDFQRKFNVHVEASVNGTLVDAIDKNKEQDPTWYQKLKATPGLVFRQDQCVFLIADASKYPMIKPQTSSP
jgi:hypothetical protein